mmetsp:Transcript_14220/g.38953  ORF Transcript_14220/g.38953 Transcript_14220/m.38953 type:complete len:346 (-) Transcript_14220:159-1196(-)
MRVSCSIRPTRCAGASERGPQGSAAAAARLAGRGGRRLMRRQMAREALASPEDVLARQPRGGLRVTGHAGLQDGLVLGPRLGAAVGHLQLVHQIALGAVQGRDRGLQVVGQAGCGIERAVEVAIQLPPAHRIAFAREGLAALLGLGQRRRAQPRHGRQDQLALQQRPEAAQLLHLVTAVAGHRVAVVTLDLHQAVLLQSVERLAHRNAAGVQLAGELFLAQRLAVLELPADDGPVQGLVDLVGRRGAWRGAGECGLLCGHGGRGLRTDALWTGRRRSVADWIQSLVDWIQYAICCAANTTRTGATRPCGKASFPQSPPSSSPMAAWTLPRCSAASHCRWPPAATA